MVGKRLSAGLAVLALVLGCAEVKSVQKEDTKEAKEQVKAQTKAKAAEKAVSYDNKKYADKLALAKDGIDFAHAFDCPGAYQNKIKDRTEDTQGRLRSYTQVVKCSVSNEIHSLGYYEISYSEKGQKSSYKLDLSCSKTGENYKLVVVDIGYDYSWGVLNYKIKVGADTLAFPDPDKKKSKKK